MVWVCQSSTVRIPEFISESEDLLQIWKKRTTPENRVRSEVFCIGFFWSSLCLTTSRSLPERGPDKTPSITDLDAVTSSIFFCKGSNCSILNMVISCKLQNNAKLSTADVCIFTQRAECLNSHLICKFWHSSLDSHNSRLPLMLPSFAWVLCACQQTQMEKEKGCPLHCSGFWGGQNHFTQFLPYLMLTPMREIPPFLSLALERKRGISNSVSPFTFSTIFP